MSIYTHSLNENLSALFGLQPQYIDELSDQELLKKPEGMVLTSKNYHPQRVYDALRDGWASGDFKHTDEFRKWASENMKKNNPMFDPKVRAKVAATRKGKPGRKLSEDEKKAISKRMRENNPMKNNPACSGTARPVTVYYTDGTIEEYSYMKEITKVKGISYSTLKLMVRENRGSVKHKIAKLVQG